MHVHCSRRAGIDTHDGLELVEGANDLDGHGVELYGCRWVVMRGWWMGVGWLSTARAYIALDSIDRVNLSNSTRDLP